MAHKPLPASLLLEARRRAGLTQRALARRAGTAQSVVAKIELGLTSPSMATVARLIAAAGFDLDVALRVKPVLDPQELDDVPRIRRLSPEDRLREVANANRLGAMARRV